jgi:hypothetical protein
MHCNAWQAQDKDDLISATLIPTFLPPHLPPLQALPSASGSSSPILQWTRRSRRWRRGDRHVQSSSKFPRSTIWSRVQAWSWFCTLRVEIWWSTLFGSARQLVVVLFLLAVLQQVESGEQCRLYPSRPPRRIS